MPIETNAFPRRAILKGAAATSMALSIAASTAAAAKASAKAEPMRDILFDSDWRFHLGDAADAHLPQFDDAAWRKLSLPKPTTSAGQLS